MPSSYAMVCLSNEDLRDANSWGEDQALLLPDSEPAQELRVLARDRAGLVRTRALLSNQLTSYLKAFLPSWTSTIGPTRKSTTGPTSAKRLRASWFVRHWADARLHHGAGQMTASTGTIPPLSSAEEPDEHDPGGEPPDMGEVRHATLSSGCDAANATDELDEEPETDQEESRDVRVPKWEDVDQDPVQRENDQERAQDAGDRTAGAEVRHRGGRIDSDLQEAGRQPADEIKQSEADRTKVVRFEFVSEHPQVDHITENVEEIRVHEHRCEQCLEVFAAGDLRWFHRVPQNETIPQGQLDEEDNDVGSDNQDENKRKSAERAGLIALWK